MSEFDAGSLNVKYLPPMNRFGPIEGRKYTLIHSEESSTWNLTVGNRYGTNQIDQKLRDEVLAEWNTKDGEYRLMGKVHISSGEYDAKLAKIRYMIFKKEVKLALTGMIYGEQELYLNYPWLLDCPIFIRFESVYPEYNQVIFYGTPRQYLAAATRKVMIKTQA